MDAQSLESRFVIVPSLGMESVIRRYLPWNCYLPIRENNEFLVFMKRWVGKSAVWC